MARRITDLTGGRRWFWSVAAMVACVAMVAAGCGSSGAGKTAHGPASAVSGASTATGTPLNVMTIAAVNSPGPTYRNIVETAKVAGKWINAHGGIKGHPLHVTTCDGKGNATKVAQCGRQAIQNHAVAVIGSFTFHGNSIIPELESAKTSWFGVCCALTPDELKSPVSQPIGSLPIFPQGMAVKATVDGCKKMALVVVNAGATAKIAIKFAKTALKAIGGPPLYKTVLLPVKPQDYSPQVSQAIDGTDCILGDFGETAYPAFLTAYKNLGGHQRIYGAQGNLDAKVTKAFPRATDGDVIVGSYSDISLPAWKDYRAALQKYDAPTKNIVYNSVAGLGTWTAYMAFKQISESMTGPINNETFLKAAQNATVNLKGKAGVGSINFGKPFRGLGPNYVNLYNRSVTYDVVHNGKVIPFDHGKFFNLTKAIEGKPLSARNTPPAGQKG